MIRKPQFPVRLPVGFSLAIALGVATTFCMAASASTINVLPGDSALLGALDDYYPIAIYYAQTFVALDEPLNALVVPVGGPASFRILIAETGEDQLRPTNILFESEEIIVPSDARRPDNLGTLYPAGEFDPETMTDEDAYPDGSLIYLHYIVTDTPGGRSEHFAYPMASSGVPAPFRWRTYPFDLAFWLGFGDDSLATFSEPLVSFTWDSPTAVSIDLGGLNLNAGQTYAVVFDGAVFIPEPSTILMLSIGLVALGIHVRHALNLNLTAFIAKLAMARGRC